MFIKLYFFAILVRCVLRRSIFGPARRSTYFKPKSILIVQLAWLGDMVCTTPLFGAVKEKYPDSRVIVIGMSRNQELLTDHPNVDRYIVWKDDFKYIKSELAREEIDFACIVTPHFLSLAYLYLTGIPLIAVPEIVGGHSPTETRSFKILRNMIALKYTHQMGSYAPREYLRLLEAINIYTENTTKILTYSAKAESNVRLLLKNNNIQDEDFLVCMSPSAGNKIKNWPAERFASLADIIIKKYPVKICLVGSAIDLHEVNTMLKNSRYSERIINTTGILSLDELKAFISGMDIFVSVDTGPIYIAEAFDVATIDIIGPMDEREQPPRGEMHSIVVSPHRPHPLIHIMNSRIYNEAEVKKSVDDISVEMVVIAFDNLYHKILRHSQK